MQNTFAELRSAVADLQEGSKGYSIIFKYILPVKIKYQTTSLLGTIGNGFREATPWLTMEIYTYHGKNARRDYYIRCINLSTDYPRVTLYALLVSNMLSHIH